MYIIDPTGLTCIIICNSGFFMARRAIPMIAFPRVRCMFIYIYIYIYIYICLWPLTRVCVVYVVKEVTSSGGLSQLMGVARKITHAQALQTSQQKESCVAYVETGTYS